MKKDKSFRGILAVTATLILPLLSSAAAPTLNDHSATGAPGALRELLLPFTGAEIGRVATTKASPVTQPRVDPAYGKLPLAFEANRGQTDSQVKFLSRGRGYTLFLTSTEAVWVLTKAEARAKRDRFPLRKPDPAQPQKVTRTVVRMKLVGSNPQPRTGGLEELPGKVNYFIGNDPTKWRTNAPTYARVEYRDVYPGVNLVYYGNQRQVEYDFVVAPGADPKVIRLAFEGVDRSILDGQGNLILHTAHGKLVQRAPVVYQEISGARREISGRYVLQGKDRVGFHVAAYDRTKPLVIDPVLVYSTYLGGGAFGGGDQGAGIAADSAGNTYVTGTTTSTDFPTAGALQPALDGSDAFVTKFDPSGAVIYSTYLGGGSMEFPGGIAADSSGNAYVTGATSSTDFPTVNPLQSSIQSGTSGYISKLNPSGSALVYSTYFGGTTGVSGGNGIAVDATGAVYVTGITDSPGFPVLNAFQPTYGGGPNDAYVAKVNPAGSALVYSTFLGGTGAETGLGIAVDVAGDAYVTGLTSSPNFLVVSALQTSFGGGVCDGFVTKLDSTGAAVYSTYLGGSGFDVGYGIAADAAGNAFVTGLTESPDFPTVTPVQPSLVGGQDAFVAKIDPAGTPLFSTFLGGVQGETGLGVGVDAAGNVYVAGHTASPDFPLVNPSQAVFAFQQAFVTKLNPGGTAFVYSTFLGGSRDNRVGGLAVDAAGNAYVVGTTESVDFPTVNAFQPNSATVSSGTEEVFVTKISPSVLSSNTPAGSGVTLPAGSGVVVSFPVVITAGNTAATTSNTGPTPPAGFSLGTPPTYYDITTTATFTSPVKVCITYDPAQFGDPRLLHFQGGSWVDVTSSLDTGDNVICGQVSSLSPFVIATAGNPLSSLGPANVWVGLKNSDDVGIRFDLRAEVYRNGTQLVGSGEATSVAGGSSGFNNARQDAVVLTPVDGATFGSGETLSIKLLVRNACTGSGKNSGTARLWFNDSAANSGFDATIGSPHTYFLGDGFALATTPGPGPKKTIDVAAGAKCSAFKSFGTWSITLP